MPKRPRSRRAPAAVELLELRVLLNAGDPDTGFGGSGYAFVHFPGLGIQINDTAIQSDGKVIVAGQIGSNIAVARLNLDGSIDTTFGDHGLFESARRAQALSVAIQSDDKILLTVFDPNADSEVREDFSVARLLADGSFDATFGNNGIAQPPQTTDFVHAHSRAVTIQHDGRVVVAGYVDTDPDSEGGLDFGVARFNTDGTVDTSFGGDGYINVPFGDKEQATAVTVDYNDTPQTNPFYGSIVVAGSLAVGDAPPSRVAVARLRSNGTLDTSSFGGDGKLVAPNLSPSPKEYATGVATKAGGRVIVSGTAGPTQAGVSDNFLLARFLSSGALDTTFGPNGTGIVENDFGNNGDDRTLDMAVGYIGDLLVCGVSNGLFCVAAYTSGGILDTRFSDDGLFNAGFPASSGGIAVTGSTIAPIRRLVLAGGDIATKRVDVGSVVTIGTFDPQATEGGDTANFIVARTERLDTPERVFLNVSGTATPPNAIPIHPADYTGTNVTFGNTVVGPSFVDIAAGSTFTVVTITAVDDTTVENDESAIFTIAAAAPYDVGAPPSATLVIRDNDSTQPPAVTAKTFQYNVLPQSVSFTFNQDVGASLSAADFEVTGSASVPSFMLGYNNVTDTATLSFSSVLQDGNYTARAIAAGINNAAGQHLTADVTLDFHFRIGDANNDGLVNFDDYVRIDNGFNNHLTGFTNGDFNYDGVVNFDDYVLIDLEFHNGGGHSTAAGMPPIHRHRSNVMTANAVP